MTRARILPLALLALLCASAGTGRALDWRESSRVSADGDAASARSDEFAWRLFVALNAPGHGRRTGNDPAVIWEDWATSVDVYRADGADPGAWPAPGAGREVAERRFESLSMSGLQNVRHIVAGKMVPLEGSLTDAPRLVEIRMNRIAYDYIRSGGLYNLEGQLRWVTERHAVQFPRGAVQLKASWRPIDVRDQGRYHSLNVRFADGSTRLFGLTALNIAAKVRPTWIWASFEHVDNAARPGADGWKLPSRDAYACRGKPLGCNAVPGGLGLERGVWQFYRLRGTMTRYVNATGAPQRLGNSELESGFQESASCMTCHARAALGLVDGKPRRLPVFAPGSGDDLRVRHGYLGVPDPAWYSDSASGDRQRSDLQPQDFVWSLAQARPRLPAGPDPQGASP
jgi:hypothetical protein